MKFLFTNALVCDPSSPFNGKKCDILVHDTKIESVSLSGKQAGQGKGVKSIDLTGKKISPGFIDMRADFCDPGFEFRETLESGARAALAGGFTHVALLPSTFPVRDTKTGIQYVVNNSANLEVTLLPYGAASHEREGKEMAELYDMHCSGAVGFTDGNKPLKDSGLVMRILQYNRIFNGLLLVFADDPSISSPGRMHEGKISTSLGLKGVPAIAEEIVVYRDIELLKYSGGRLHFSTITSKGTVELIRKAKKSGLQVTCDVAVANLCYTEENLQEYDVNFKVKPVLRSKQDQKALWDGIADGTIDAVSSNHHPLSVEDKAVEFEYAAYGMSTIQTAFRMLLSAKPETLSMDLLIGALTTKPAGILGINNVGIVDGKDANLVVFENSKEYPVENLISKSVNSPVKDQKLKGKVEMVYTKQTLHTIN